MEAYFSALMILAMTMMTRTPAVPQSAVTNKGVSVQIVTTNTMNEKIKEHLHPGEPIKVAVGQKFSIRIAANPSTGYGWQLSQPPDAAVTMLVTNSYIQKRTDMRVGVGGHEVWTFKAVGQGRTDISLQYVRSWEKDVPPVRTNVFTVIVK